MSGKCTMVEVVGAYQFALDPPTCPDGRLPGSMPACLDEVSLLVSNADDSERARQLAEQFLEYVRNHRGPLLATEQGGDAADDG